MRRASLTVAFLAIMTVPAFAQTQPRPNDGIPVTDVRGVVERNGSNDDPLVVVTPVPVQQKTRSLVARSSNNPVRIDFRIPWQTGIYQ